jgi:hypothetical protein
MSAESKVYPIVYEKIPFSTYRELPGEHSTGLRRALVSPLEYDHYKRNEREDSDTLRVGRGVHTAVLEPLQFLREYVLFDGRRAGKIWDAFEVEHAGKTILKHEQYDPIVAMAEAIRGHPVAGPLFAGRGRNEWTVQWRHSSGALCKARIDRLTATDLIDIKTAADITPHGFSSSAMRYGYFTQMAFYHDACVAAGLGLPRVKIVAVQKKAPFDVVAYEIGDDELAAGREQYERALSIVAECNKSGEWPGQAPIEAVPLKLPSWAQSFNEDAVAGIMFGDEVVA